jgi:hypothetical protein
MTVSSEALRSISSPERLDSPLAPFFDKSWRPNEIEVVT